MSGKGQAAAAARWAPALPEDVIADILARVPTDVAFLFRCALVCKRWCRVLTDPAFLRRLLPEAGRSSLIGFLVQRHRPSLAAWRTVANIFMSRVPAFVPAPGSALGRRRRFLSSFVRDDAGLLNNAEPRRRAMASFSCASPHPRPPRVVNFSACVCAACLQGRWTSSRHWTPLASTTRVSGDTPLTSCNRSDVPHQPADGYSNLCHVLLIGVHQGNKQLHIHSFSSAAAASQNWSTTPANCFPGSDSRLFSGPCGRVAAVCHDTAHWLFEEHGSTGPSMCTLDVSVHADRVCASKIIFYFPFPSFNAEVDWSNARLHLSNDEKLLLLYENRNHLMIWTRQDVVQGSTAVWTCPQGILAQGILVDMKELWSPRMPLTTVCVGEKSYIMLMHSQRNCAYVLDVQSKSTTKVAGWNGSFNYKTAVPYDVNWPEFFMSRLDVQL